MDAKLSQAPIPAGPTPDKRLSRWNARCRRALTDPVELYRRALNGWRWSLYSALLNLCCDVLFRWGDRLGVPGNLRARVYWKANRREIVPLRQLYDFMSQERAAGQYYPLAPKCSSRSHSLVNILSPLIGKDDSILEIGCNIGRNLNHLWQVGYKNLRGMEISQYVVKRLRSEYPDLAMVPVEIGPAELSIQRYGTRSVDVIFTMAVLEHLHPDCKSLFMEIARVARKYVLAIEPRRGKRSHMQHPWDIEKEFTAVGLTCVAIQPWSALWEGALTIENEWADDMHAYDAFLFRVDEAER